MSRVVFSFRPNLKNPDHKAAWEILERVPEGQKTGFVVQAVLHEREAGYLENLIRRAVREELNDRSIRISGENEAEATVPEQVLDFISMLQDE